MGLFDNLSGEQNNTDMPANKAPAASADVTTTPAANAAPAADPAANNEPPAGGQSPQSQAPNTAKPADAPTADANKPAPDFNAMLDEMSGGVIKDEAGFKAFLPKLTEYETLRETNERLAAEMAGAPKFVDDEVRILNELKAAGASKEQIKTFHKINEYGSIKEMPDRDALIAKMVMIDGVKPSVAEKKVDREYKIGDESVSEEDREIMDDDLRVAANKTREELEKFKTAVSTANNLPPEELRLQQQAELMQHQANVKPYVADVVKAIPHMGEYVLSPKTETSDEVKFTVPIDDAVRAQISQHLENYFMDGQTEVTPATTREALEYSRAEYFKNNAEKIFQAIDAAAVARTEERMIAKYENRSGLKPQGDNPVQGDANDATKTATFMQKVATRTT